MLWSTAVSRYSNAVPRFCISEKDTQKSAHLAIRLTHTAGGDCRRSGFDCVQLRRGRRQARHGCGGGSWWEGGDVEAPEIGAAHYRVVAAV